MNRLSTADRARVVASLVEGNSIRATVRMTGVANNTITKLLVDLGAAWRSLRKARRRSFRCLFFRDRALSHRSGHPTSP